ncbi:MAG: hypothetical protein K2K08_09035 [Paramuribaculum sp.]|nr:hypothetical protein [Paramuribaculum sp.]
MVKNNKANRKNFTLMDIKDLLHPKLPIPKYNSQETLDAVAKIETLEEEIEAYLSENHPGINNHLIGFCHYYWAAKKSILKNKYGIEWFSPQDENPLALFD